MMVTIMDFTEAMAIAENTLMSGATLDELTELVSDLRALSPDSALAELAEAKIEQILAERGRAGLETRENIFRRSRTSYY